MRSNLKTPFLIFIATRALSATGASVDNVELSTEEEAFENELDDVTALENEVDEVAEAVVNEEVAADSDDAIQGEATPVDDEVEFEGVDDHEMGKDESNEHSKQASQFVRAQEAKLNTELKSHHARGANQNEESAHEEEADDEDEDSGDSLEGILKAADTNGDGKLSVMELVAEIGEQKKASKVAAVVKKGLELFDENMDGFASLDEMPALSKYFYDELGEKYFDEVPLNPRSAGLS